MDLILACDLGGTSLKGALVTFEGRIKASQAVSFQPPAMDGRGFSELEPEVWWTEFLGLTDRLLAAPEVLPDRVAGVCLCGLTRTQVFLDREGRSVRPAISWADGRAQDQARRIIALARNQGPASQTFGPINAFHTLARLLWLKEEEPESFGRVEKVLEPKDFLNFRLTGLAAGDNISLARLLNVPKRAFCRELLAGLDLDPELIPPLLDPWEKLGRVGPGLPPPLDRLAGTTVFVGGMDAWCGCLGTGALKPGRAYNVSGTSEVLGLVVEKYRESRGLVSLPWGPGLFQIGGPSQAGADCLAWILEVLQGGTSGRAVEEALEGLGSPPRDRQPVLFLPYLRGERAPLWEPEARGALVGLDRGHGRADFLWSVMEGVAMANRQVLESVTGGWTEAGDQVRISGGAAESDLWCQVKADVLARPVVRTEVREAGLLGAAMVALRGLGRFTGLDQAQENLVRVERVFSPNEGRAAFYDRLYPKWREAQQLLLPLTRHLTGEFGQKPEAGQGA